MQKLKFLVLILAVVLALVAALLYFGRHLFLEQTTQSEPMQVVKAQTEGQTQEFWYLAEESRAFNDSVKKMIAARDARGLHDLATQLVASKERLSSGTIKLKQFYDVIMDHTVDPLLVSALEKLREENPTDQVYVTLLVAMYLDLADEARGIDYASTVSKDGWKLYQEYQERMASIIQPFVNGTYPITDPYLMGRILWLATIDGAEKQQIVLLQRDAFKAHPYYDHFHATTAIALLRRWGGAPSDLPQYLEAVRTNDGNRFYALIAYELSVRHGALREANMQWKYILNGYEDLLKEVSDPVGYTNQLVSLACYYQDAATIKRYAPMIEGKLTSVWPNTKKYQDCLSIANHGLATTHPALEKAVLARDVSSVRQQLADKSLANAVDSEGFPLAAVTTRAESPETTEILKLFLDAGANLNFVFPSGAKDSLLNEAVEHANIAAAELLIARGADVNHETNNRWPLYYASIHNNPEMVRFLVSKGAKVDLADSSGASALYYTASRGHAAVISTLLALKADPNMLPSHGYTALYGAAYDGKLEALKALLASSAIQVDLTQEPKQWTPLMGASYQGHLEIVKALVHHGADLEKLSSDYQQTALSLAAQYGHFEVVKYLVQAGANMNTKASGKYTPEMLARGGGFPEIADFLHVQNGQ